jgi:hypothetical protein
MQDSKLEIMRKMLRPEIVSKHEELFGGTVEYLKGLEDNIQASRSGQATFNIRWGKETKHWNKYNKISDD